MELGNDNIWSPDKEHRPNLLVLIRGHCQANFPSIILINGLPSHSGNSLRRKDVGNTLTTPYWSAFMLTNEILTKGNEGRWDVFISLPRLLGAVRSTSVSRGQMNRLERRNQGVRRSFIRRIAQSTNRGLCDK